MHRAIVCNREFSLSNPATIAQVEAPSGPGCVAGEILAIMQCSPFIAAATVVCEYTENSGVSLGMPHTQTNSACSIACGTMAVPTKLEWVFGITLLGNSPHPRTYPTLATLVVYHVLLLEC